jgi:D-alanine-D-alanine ligase
MNSWQKHTLIPFDLPQVYYNCSMSHSDKTKVRVGVLRGGPSSEYEVSLSTGGAVLQHLGEHYHPVDILISRDGQWHMNGFVRDPHDVVKHIDVVFNALHGEYGEDGKVQQILERLGMPYTGSGPLASALGMNKVLSKKVFKDHGIKTPIHTVVTREKDIHETAMQIFRTFPMPAVVKPVSAGSSVGVTIARDFKSLEEGIRKAAEHGDAILIEEYIKGKEATCGVLEDFRDEDVYSLLPIEIVPKKDFFDYSAKYAGESDKICPGNFTPEESAEIQRVAKLVHKALGLRHYSRTDFIVSPRRGIYVLEVNTQPGFTPESLFPKAVNAVGSNFPDLLHHLISLALKK